MRQPWWSSNERAGGASAAAPAGAPLSAQRTRVSISAWSSVRSLENTPWNSGAANHGGMARDCTFFAIDLAQGRASS